MRPSWRSLSALLLVAVIVLAGSTQAERKEGTEVLVMDEHTAIQIDVEEGAEIEVRIFVAVTDGPKIDVFFMTEKAYDDYRFQEDFDHYVDYSAIATKNVDKTFEWDGEGTYFVVIDNTISETPPPMDPEFANATVRYVITWEVIEGLEVRDYIIYAIIAVMVIFGLALVFRYFRKR